MVRVFLVRVANQVKTYLFRAAFWTQQLHIPSGRHRVWRHGRKLFHCLTQRDGLTGW